ncbi:Ig-like domain-containing protein [Turneriella parva]|uniref:SbsA Ig-like domain-containing protein n=1 Tax=Turneriella parva (strain ATCC BAA-1111 / DSM 21527 / NCTC 11395 / H) TaxID=869212 RepID=I4B3B4_TURPD|nr:Ig-like domain-containing protein [Turneriella parva]AFM11771.1 hypothetical protein Turpa_1123 [Turneriella parva DSM 21527]
MKKTRTNNRIRIAILLTVATGLNPWLPVFIQCAYNPNDNCLNPASSCFVPDKEPPTIANSSPANGATIRSASDLVTITFSEPVKNATVTSNYVFSGVGGSGLAAASVNKINDREYRLTVTGVLGQGAVALSINQITDWAGNPYTGALNFTASQDLNWTQTDSLTSRLWTNLAFGNNRFVLVSSGTNFNKFSIDNGHTWADATNPNGSWNNIIYGGGLFVATAGSGTDRIMTSPDGITWTVRTQPEANSWSSVAYGNGLYVGVSSSGTNRVMTSSDGVTWISQPVTIDIGWAVIAYGNGSFVALGSSGGAAERAMKSTDGINWTYHTLPENNAWRKIVYAEGLFVAISNAGTTRVITSPDGENWTGRTVPNQSWYNLSYGDGLFVAIALSTNLTMRSTNGIDWTLNTALLPGSGSWNSVAFGNGTFVTCMQSSVTCAWASWP